MQVRDRRIHISLYLLNDMKDMKDIKWGGEVS